jgi:nucleotide-binding universal stress UspA family protein
VKIKLPKRSVNARRKGAVPKASSKIRNILATTDFSNESLAGVRYGVALTEKLGAAVALVHVVELASRMAGMEAVALALPDSEVTKHARVHLKTLAKRESKGDLKLTPFVSIGNPVHEITTVARQRAADLIVIATHGYTGPKRVLLGSTAERVVRHAPCPVLTVPARTTFKRTGKTPPLMLKKILVPIDFSNISKGSLPLATFLAAKFDAEIILLHVVEKFPIDYLAGRELINQTITPLMKQGEADLKRMVASLSKSAGLRVSAVVRDGKPFEEIYSAAQRLGVDLIALTTHGYTGLKHVWLGSTAERVVRRASCPVLIVRELNRKKS